MAERSGDRVKAPCGQSLSPAGVEPPTVVRVLTAMGYQPLHTHPSVLL
jgi:hypothetical protein